MHWRLFLTPRDLCDPWQLQLKVPVCVSGGWSPCRYSFRRAFAQIATSMACGGMRTMTTMMTTMKTRLSQFSSQSAASTRSVLDMIAQGD
eukprot:572761-Amphidinium_carterae.2